MTTKVKNNGNGNGNGNAAQSAKEVQNAAHAALKAKAEALKTESEKLKEENARLKAEAEKLKVEKPKEHPVLSLEKKIQKVEELNIIIEKWRKLNDAKQNVNGFKLGNDGLSVTLTLQDASGKTFKTSHNVVVTSVLESLQNELDGKIAEVEKQINFLD